MLLQNRDALRTSSTVEQSEFRPIATFHRSEWEIRVFTTEALLTVISHIYDDDSLTAWYKADASEPEPVASSSLLRKFDAAELGRESESGPPSPEDSHPPQLDDENMELSILGGMEAHAELDKAEMVNEPAKHPFEALLLSYDAASVGSSLCDTPRPKSPDTSLLPTSTARPPGFKPSCETPHRPAWADVTENETDEQEEYEAAKRLWTDLRAPCSATEENPVASPVFRSQLGINSIDTVPACAASVTTATANADAVVPVGLNFADMQESCFTENPMVGAAEGSDTDCSFDVNPALVNALVDPDPKVVARSCPDAENVTQSEAENRAGAKSYVAGGDQDAVANHAVEHGIVAESVLDANRVVAQAFQESLKRLELMGHLPGKRRRRKDAQGTVLDILDEITKDAPNMCPTRRRDFTIKVCEATSPITCDRAFELVPAKTMKVLMPKLGKIAGAH